MAIYAFRSFLTERVSEETLRKYFKLNVCHYYPSDISWLTEPGVNQLFNKVVEKSKFIKLFTSYENSDILEIVIDLVQDFITFVDPSTANKLENKVKILDRLSNSSQDILTEVKNYARKLLPELTAHFPTIDVTVGTKPGFWKSFFLIVFPSGIANDSGNSVTFSSPEVSKEKVKDAVNFFVELLTKLKEIKTKTLKVADSESLEKAMKDSKDAENSVIDFAIEKVKTIYKQYDGTLFPPGQDFISLSLDVPKDTLNSTLDNFEKLKTTSVESDGIKLNQYNIENSNYSFSFKKSDGKTKTVNNVDFKQFYLALSQIKSKSPVVKELQKQFQEVVFYFAYRIIISRDLTAMLEISTTRKGEDWSSCMRVDNTKPWGIMASRIEHNLLEGSLVGYVVPRSEPDSAIPNSPVGRILIHPYKNKSERILANSGTWYGVLSKSQPELIQLVHNTVDSWLKSKFPNSDKKIFTLVPSIYRDKGTKRTVKESNILKFKTFREFI